MVRYVALLGDDTVVSSSTPTSIHKLSRAMIRQNKSLFRLFNHSHWDAFKLCPWSYAAKLHQQSQSAWQSNAHMQLQRT